MTDQKQEYLELEDRRISKANLDAHRKIVEAAAQEFKSPVSWVRMNEGFKRGATK